MRVLNVCYFCGTLYTPHNFDNNKCQGCEDVKHPEHFSGVVEVPGDTLVGNLKGRPTSIQFNLGEKNE